MPTSWNKITHATTTPKDTVPGYGIWADNEEFYADNENYYADGAVVMNDIIAMNYLFCNNTDVLCSSEEISCIDRFTNMVYAKEIY